VCSRTPITQPASGDGCCPPGATHAQDADCPAVDPCGNGVLDPGEACDTAIPGSCPASCTSKEICVQARLVGERCAARCEFTPKPPGAADGCCPGPMYGGVDPDCPPLPTCGGGPFTFDAEKKWDWDSAPLLLKTNGSMGVSPVVARFKDTNGDGRIDKRDVPGVLAIINGLMGPPPSNNAPPSVVAMLDGATGATRWVKDGSTFPLSPFVSPAVGDLDGDGVPEIVSGLWSSQGSSISGLIALDASGNVKWRSDALAYSFTGDIFGAPAIADLDGDGAPEVIFGNHVFDAKGKLKWHGPSTHQPDPMGRISIVAKFGGAPGLQILDGNTLYAADGTQLWSQPAVGYAFPAVADCDGNGKPSIFMAGQPSSMSAPSIVLLNADGSVRKGPVSVPSLRPNTPVAAGDVDGDGRPEFIAAATTGLVILDCDLKAKATATIVDISGASGPVLFDFDGDGAMEIVYADELKIRVFDGRGRQLWSDDRPSPTGLDTPVVADVDGDGHAEIIVPRARNQLTPSGLPTPQGVRVYRARGNPWRNAPGIWNEHAFHALNVFEDGRIPVDEGEWWRTFNGFRAAMSLSNTTCP